MNIFIAFAKEDLAVRDKLLRQMNLVANKQGWNIWSAKEIKAGERWDAEIKQRLMDSEVVILLLSMDFFNSKYIVETELPKVVEMHESGNCQIIPVIARVCHWKETTFGEYAELGDIQALPVGEKPIVSRGHWDNDDQPYFETVQGIRDSIKAFRTKSQAEQDAETQRARVIEQAEKDRIAALAAQREAEKEAESERLRSAESDRQRKEASERRTRSIEEQSNAYRRADQAHWEQAADDDTIEAYNTYLAQYPYPYGRMNSDAHLRIKELKKQNAAPIPWGRYVAIGGVNITGIITLQHTLRKHGNPMTEAARGQIAVAPETFEFISLIVSKYDRLQYEFVKNRHSFLFEKMIGDRVCHYIAEIRVGRKKQICAQSLWIRKTKKPLV